MKTFNETFVCLANSRKHSGRCIAGKRVSDNSWVRVIGTNSEHAITEYDRRFQDGNTAQVLDILMVPCKNAVGNGFQSENVIIDPGFYWEKKGEISWHELYCLATDTDLWPNGESSSKCLNNRIQESEIESIYTSLRLIYVKKLTLQAGPKAPEYKNNKFVVRAIFEFNNTKYILDVTDPIYERKCMGRGEGEYVLESAILCVSLGELYKHSDTETSVAYSYKLVAAIFTKEDVL